MGLGEEKEGSRSGSSMRKGTGKPRRRGLCEREKMWRKMLEGKSKKKGGKLGKLCSFFKKKLILTLSSCMCLNFALT